MKASIHCGRCIILVLRTGINEQRIHRKYAICPLSPKTAFKGCAPGAESVVETVKQVRRISRRGSHVAAVDGSPAIHKAAAACGVPSAPGVCKIFSPLSKIMKPSLDDASATLLRQLKPDGFVKEKRDHYLLVVATMLPKGWWIQVRTSFGD